MSFPHDYQLDSKDCGPSCLKIILRFYGKYFNLPYIREICGISREGVSFYDLAEAAEKLKLRSRCYSVAFEDLRDKIPLPCIVHWNENHFVVVYKIKGKKVYVSDPNLGLTRYATQDFVDAWSGRNEENKGRVIAIEPETSFFEDIQSQERTNNASIFRLLQYFKPYKGNIANLLIIMLLVTVLQGILPFISRAVIDVGIQTGDVDFINMVLFGNLAIILAVLIGNSIRDWILLQVSSRVNIAMVSEYLIKMLQLPVSFFETKLTGDILQRADDHERVRTFITGNALNLVFAAITFVAFSLVLLFFNPMIFAIFVVGNSAYVAWILSTVKWRKRLDWETYNVNSKNQSYWVETISSIQDIKVNNYEVQRRWDWEKIQAKLYRINQRVLKLNNIQSVIAQFISSLTNLVITFYCAKAVVAGTITFGTLISTQFMIGMLAGPVAQFIQYVHTLQYAKISFERLNEIHSLEPEQSEDVINNFALPDFKSILVKDVSFRYTVNSKIILRNVSFLIPEKFITAIVGDSGSGKTTLLKLLLRLYEPTVGDVQVGNMNLKNIDLKHWRSRCACVLQDGKIFNDTVLRNITLGDQNVDYDKLRQCANVANISKEIEEMPSGYKTMLGETGQGISGGQKQRLLIARALYKDPDYLLMDEATNSLDAVNEQKIVEALDSVFKDKTVVIVAHRLSTIQRAHQIIVMKAGEIVEVGNHQSLLNLRGYYCQLINAQLGESNLVID